MSEANAKKFLDALEKKKILKKALNIEDSMVNIAKVYDPKLDFTAEELDRVIEEKWGQRCSEYLALFCFSEVPGF